MGFEMEDLDTFSMTVQDECRRIGAVQIEDKRHNTKFYCDGLRRMGGKFKVQKKGGC